MKLLRMIAVKVGRALCARGGNTMVEFAVVLPLFLLLTLGILDFGRLFWTQETMSYALREAGRYAVTGQHMTGTNGSAEARVQSIINVAEQYSAGLINAQNASQITVSSGGATNYAGGPGETVIISLTTGLKLLTPVGVYFPNNTYTFTTSTAFRNEPFNPAMAN